MTCAKHAIGILAALAFAAVSLPANAWASVDKPMSPGASESPEPKPTKTAHVSGRTTKDGAQLNATGSVDGRLADSRPPKKGTPMSTRNERSVREPRRSGRTKETPAADTPERVDFKLNTGICGLMQADGTMPGPNRCQPVIPDEPLASRRRVPQVVAPRPQDVTWGMVLAETKVVLFPGLSVKVQPEGRTLVNFDTIVYTDESKVSTTPVTLLGFPVVVEATPISYSWNFGDGSPVLTTSTPGKPYPSKEITHKYMKRGAVSITLTTNYAARFNVAGTGWQYVDGTIPVTGPATPLQVREAVPVLVDPPN
jgi:hypothetical protein